MWENNCPCRLAMWARRLCKGRAKLNGQRQCEKAKSDPLNASLLRWSLVPALAIRYKVAQKNRNL